MLQHFVHLPRLLDLYAQQRSAGCAFHHQSHLRNLRRQPRHLLDLRAEHGLRDQAATARRNDHQSRRSGRIHVRSQHLPGQSGRRRLLRDDGEGDEPERLGEGANDTRAAFKRSRLPHDRGHHARLESIRGRVLSRDVAGQSLYPRDVLFDGRAPRPSIHALSRRRRHCPVDSNLYRLSSALDALLRVHEEVPAVAR